MKNRINDWMKDSEFESGIQMFKEYKKQANRIQRERLQQRKIKEYNNYQERLYKECDIELYFHNQISNGTNVDIFTMEGIENTMMIVDNYRKIGHSMNLRKLVIRVDNKNIKEITFTY